MVENLDDSLSVNHNWINGYNIGWVWDYLQRQSSVAEAVVHAEDAPQNSWCVKLFNGIGLRHMARDYAPGHCNSTLKGALLSILKGLQY